MASYSKTINLNGETKKVLFENKLISKELSSPNENRTTHKFIVDGKEFILNCVNVRGKSGKFSAHYLFNGIKFPDSEKKVIEYLLTK